MFKIDNHIWQLKSILKMKKMKTGIFIIHNFLSICSVRIVFLSGLENIALVLSVFEHIKIKQRCDNQMKQPTIFI